MFETQQLWLEAQQARVEKHRQKQRYRRAPRPTAVEIERMVASFIAERGCVTDCPPKFLLPTSKA